MSIPRTASVPWQTLASAHVTGHERVRCKNQGPKRSEAHRSVPQCVVRVMRDERFNCGKTIGWLAYRYGLTCNYVRNVVENGLRDDERERGTPRPMAEDRLHAEIWRLLRLRQRLPHPA